MRKKEIIIRNLDALEDYLGVDARGRGLRRLDLQRNRRVKGVGALLARIPDGFDLHALARFRAETGLTLRVTHYTAENEVRIYDRHGVYPRPFLCFSRPDAAAIFARLPDHPEWLEPQEPCDLELRYVDPLRRELRGRKREKE